MRILLVGNGFIGNRFISLYKANYDFTILTRRNDNKLLDIKQYIVNENIAFDISCFENIDIVLYTAYDESYKNNITLLKKIYQNSKKFNIKKIIYLGTMSIYDFIDGKIDENSKKQTIKEYYAYSKLLLNKLVKKYANEYNINTIILHPSIVLGKGGSWDFYAINSLLKTNIKLPNKGQGIANIIHAEDVANAINLAIQTSVTKNIEEILLSSDLQISWLDFYTMYKKLLIGLGYSSGNIIFDDNQNKFAISKKKDVIYHLLYTKLGFYIYKTILYLKKNNNFKRREITFNENIIKGITEPVGIYKVLHNKQIKIDNSKIKNKLGISFLYNNKDILFNKLLEEYSQNKK